MHRLYAAAFATLVFMALASTEAWAYENVDKNRLFEMFERLLGQPPQPQPQPPQPQPPQPQPQPPQPQPPQPQPPQPQPPSGTCNPSTGGSGCFGQSWSGTFYTWEDELAGNVQGPLFVPNRNNYHTAIFSPHDMQNIPMKKETYWGCSSEVTPFVRTMPRCNLSASLKGNVTYMYRLRTTSNGHPIASSVIVENSQMLDELGSYIFGISNQPNAIGSGPDQKCFKLTPSSAVGFSGPIHFPGLSVPGCRYLDTSRPVGGNHLYLKFKATGTKTDRQGNPVLKNGVPITADECGRTIKCRLYVRSW